MKDVNLDRLIGVAKDRPLPACPPALEANVLRRLRVESEESKEHLSLDWILGLFLQTRYAVAAAAAVLFISATTSVVATSAQASEAERRILVTSALDFDVFQQSEVLNLSK